MRFTNLRLDNWRNFVTVDVPLARRVFVVGPNASGKSNLLDAFRFLRDIAEPQGGLARAVDAPSRGGISHLRSLYARQQPNVVVEVKVELDDSAEIWSYHLELAQDNNSRPVVRRELVSRGNTSLLNRPLDVDADDPSLLRQTHLEQLSANGKFRQLAEALARVRYLHLVPQLVREPDRSMGRKRDPHGGDFLEQVAGTQPKTQAARLDRIVSALQVAVPQLKKLELARDARGVPHLQALQEHWRPNAGWLGEEHLSDGTLRFLGLLWAFLDGNDPLLLEEPELSLHAGVVRHIPQMLWRLGKRQRQVMLSTHSRDLLLDPGIAADELLTLEPEPEGTKVVRGADDEHVRALLESGLSAGDVVIPRTEPKLASQLALFGE